MRRILVSALIVGIAGAPRAGAAEPPYSPTIAVSVNNAAGVPPDIVRDAQQQMAWIYRIIGIAIQWGEATITESQFETAAAANDQQSGRPPAFAIFIRAKPPSTRQAPSATLGAARTRGAERGWIADIYWDSIEKFRPYHARILGHVMAHEVGHLLLPTLAHSLDGLMRAGWDRNDMERLKTGGLLFTSDQGALIRRRIADLTRGGVIDFRLAGSASK